MNRLDPDSDLASETSLWTFGIDDDEQTIEKPQLPKLPKNGRRLKTGHYITTPTEVPDRAVPEMIYSDKDRLGTTRSGKPCYRHSEPMHRTTVVCVPPKGKEIDDLAEYNARILSGMNPRTADVFFILSAHSREYPDENGYVTVTASDILAELGVQPMKKIENGIARTAGHRSESIDEINEYIQQLRGLKLIVSKTTLINGRKPSQPLVYKGYLLVLEGEYSKEKSERAYAWRFKMYDGLEDLVRNERFRHVYRRALTYNPVRHSPEKRLSYLIDTGFRLNGNRSFHQNLGLIMDKLNLPFDDVNPGRWITRFVKALNKLQADGGLATSPKGWAFEGRSGLKTQDIEALFRTKDLPPRNFKDALRDMDLWLFPPLTLPEIKRRRKKLNSSK